LSSFREGKYPQPVAFYVHDRLALGVSSGERLVKSSDFTCGRKPMPRVGDSIGKRRDVLP
jgi:hypothetical protein